MEQILDMHDYVTTCLILQLDLQALAGERLSNGGTDNSTGGIVPKALDLLPVHLNRFRFLCNAKDLDLRPLEFANVTLACAMRREHTIVILKSPLEWRCLLFDGDTIVEIQRSTSRPIPRRSYHQLKILLPQVGRRVRTLDT